MKTRICLSLIALLTSQCSGPNPVARLSRIVDGHWPVDGRLAGVADQKPRTSDMPSATADQIRQAFRVAEKATESADRFGIWALVPLLEGKPERAVAHMEQAALINPDNPELWNDLAVACLTAAVGTDWTLPAISALEAIDKAVELDPQRPEFLFNRALILQRLRLDFEAKAAWRAALPRQRSPVWRAEAERRLDLLHNTAPPGNTGMCFGEWLAMAVSGGDVAGFNALMTDFPGEARRYAEETLLLQWAQGGAKAKQAKRQAKAIGHALAKKDPSIAHAVEALSALETDSREMGIMADGLARLRVARTYHEQGCEDHAAVMAQEALDLFGGIEPFCSWSKMALARALYRQENRNEPPSYDAALAILKEIGAIAETLGHRALLGRALGVRALISGRCEDLKYLLIHNQDALGIFRVLGEKPYIANYAKATANSHHLHGDFEEALKRRGEALDLVDGLANFEARFSLFNAIGRDLQALDRFATAAYFFREKTRLARLDGRAGHIASALWTQACNLKEVGKLDEALSLLDEALIICRKDKTQSGELEAEILLARGECRLPNEPRKARPDLEAARSLFEQCGAELRLARCLGALAHADQGGDGSVEALLEEGAAWVERHRLDTYQDHKRIVFLDQAIDLFDDLARFYLNSGRPDQAMAAADRGRARFMQDHMAFEWPASQIPSLAKGEALVYFYQLPEKTLAWVLRPEEEAPHFFELSIGAEKLAGLVEPLWAELGQGETGIAGRLYCELIAPLKALLSDKETLILAPHGPLWAVPFAALHDGERWLAERWRFSAVPSLTALRRSGGVKTSGKKGRALIIGDPAQALVDKPSLPHAREEAKLAQAILHKSYTTSLPIDAPMTDTAFLREAETANVIVFAGHGVINTHNPLLSCLVFAPDSATDSHGMVTARDLYQLRFSELELVVLSACDSGGVDGSLSEGGGVLARPFLAAGAKSVAATLRPVPDQAEILSQMNDFYSSWLVSGSSAEALHHAQKRAIARNTPASLWALYQVFGAP